MTRTFVEDLSDAEEILLMLDAFMQHASEYVRIFICDSEACNLMLKALIHGTVESSMKRKIAETRFFSRIRYCEVPGLSDLPSFPMRLCQFDGDFLYCMPGAAHAAKNSCAQLMAPHKLLHFGAYFADASGTLLNDMPLPAFCRRDPMSDRLASLLACPFYMVGRGEPWCMCYHMLSCSFPSVSLWFPFTFIQIVLNMFV